MHKLEQKHYDFLKLCASLPNKIHESDLPPAELDQMALEGLLIRYGGVNTRYCISKSGTRFIKDYLSRETTVSPEIKKLAVNYVMTKGYEQEAAEKIVDETGAEPILKSQAEEMRQGTQREVKVPTNAQGVPEIKFRA